ncbi:MAG TPA: metal-dependent hydrolase [Chitinophagaceae bacterium]
MKFTYYGHACFSIEVTGKKLLFDPFITPNPAAKEIDVNSIGADYIFISHGHGDHIADAVSVAGKTGALCVGSAEVEGWLQKNGVERTHGMNHGGYIQFDFGRVKGVNAIHSSSFPDGSYAGNPMGFVFNTGEADFYYTGDTALTMDMQLVPAWARLRFAVMPIGGNFTMDPYDALKAAEFVKCDTVIGVHYNTFPPITIDTDAATALFEKAGKRLLLPAIGQTIEL